MATNVKDISKPAEPRCDAHSKFTPDGFPLPLEDGERREWSPRWGGPCGVCGADC
ncbi:hypothetical protein GCM10009574_023470 [Streptomyces asiaticus]